MHFEELREYSSLIGMLYDAATNASKWEEFLEGLCDMFESDGAHLQVSSFQGHDIYFSAQYGGNGVDLQAIATRNFDPEDDQRMQYVSERPFRPFHCGMLPSQDAYRNSRIVKELFQPNGMDHQLIVGLPESEKDRSAGLVIWRSRDRGPYTSKACELLGEIAPHLRRVMDLQDHFHKTQFEDNPALDVLETMPIGVILCDAGARTHFVNALAREIIGQNDGLVCRQGELWGNRPEVTRDLRQAIHRAVESVSEGEQLPVATMTLDRPSGKSALLVVVSVVGTTSLAMEGDLFRQPVAVVYVSDPEYQQETSQALLQRLFAFTNAEARLVKALVDGASLKEAAADAGIAESTARGYLKQVFAKTKTNSQVDLLRRVSNSPAWLRHQSAVPLLTAAE